MPQEKYEVKTYQIDFKCDICGKGYYRPTGIIFPTHPMKVEHKCNFCGAKIIVEEHEYPYTVYEEGTKKQ